MVRRLRYRRPSKGSNLYPSSSDCNKLCIFFLVHLTLLARTICCLNDSLCPSDGPFAPHLWQTQLSMIVAEPVIPSMRSIGIVVPNGRPVFHMLFTIRYAHIHLTIKEAKHSIRLLAEEVRQLISHSHGLQSCGFGAILTPRQNRL